MEKTFTFDSTDNLESSILIGELKSAILDALKEINGRKVKVTIKYEDVSEENPVFDWDLGFTYKHRAFRSLSFINLGKANNCTYSHALGLAETLANQTLKNFEKNKEVENWEIQVRPSSIQETINHQKEN